MKRSFQEYLRKRAELDHWPLVAGSLEGIEQVVVIPALAEREHLFLTLGDLGANDADALRKSLVICVVNNRPAPHSDPAMIQDNADTLARLESLRRSGPLRLAYVDASSPGRELPPKNGVGLARKIGMDWGISILADTDAGPGLLLCLDADTRVQPNYLVAVRTAFQSPVLSAAVVDYAHPLEESGEAKAAILCYELFLRYHVLGLRFAGSPYAFPTIGSTMVCRAEAYVAVSGMNRRQAGEDFYFLQNLAKSGRVGMILETTVFPSGRPSNRVPFGTGLRVAQFHAQAQDAYLVYHPAIYTVVKRWLQIARAGLHHSTTELIAEAEAVEPALAAFLRRNDFECVWERLRAHSGGPQALLRQFHRWFDGFKAIKLIHYLRDNGYPQQNTFSAIRALLDRIGMEAQMLKDADFQNDSEQQEALLHTLRRLERETAPSPLGLPR